MAETTGAETTGAPEKASHKPTRTGVVMSDKMDKTITVVVQRLVRHPLYRKYVRRKTVLKAHDEEQVAKVGDRVEVEFSRPISKSKCWRLIRVIDKRAGS